MFALESAGKSCSAVIIRDGTILAQEQMQGQLRHSINLMPLVDRVFKQSGVKPSDIEIYSAGAGPGSFTGLRIAIGTIKGLAFPFHTPCIGVSTLESLAWNVQPTESLILSVIDARRERVYTASFRGRDGIERLSDDAVISILDLVERYRDEKVLLVGDASPICYNNWHGKGNNDRVSHVFMEPNAIGTALAALPYALRGETVSPVDLLPRYILLPQAERERLHNKEEKT